MVAPHTWRIPLIGCPFLLLFGITSTYVENTCSAITPADPEQDHLHIRGEYLLCNYSSGSGTGSPPHTWRIHKEGKEVLEIT
ncbi:hypothetical protein, partial [Lactobacillus helveticus]|uniref:hypothetical protein n=1 Tax=Lactobacillus helveticus TaxID=1587 RepID=UPI001C2C061A